ncbi:MAG: hypothetical protein KJ072_09965 [Verrucomicrobia bacterium]|nr:hypothetical protein [Verrucomicrobiota bacterium]
MTLIRALFGAPCNEPVYLLPVGLGACLARGVEATSTVGVVSEGIGTDIRTFVVTYIDSPLNLDHRHEAPR